MASFTRNLDLREGTPARQNPWFWRVFERGGGIHAKVVNGRLTRCARCTWSRVC